VAVARPLLERARSRELQVTAHDPGDQAVVKLIRSPTVRCRADAAIREVAERMTELGASAAIIDLPAGGLGIVTDRDFRTRVAARGVPLSSPVEAVMSTPVFCVPPDRLGREVLFELLERGIRHAPIVDERGRLVGVIEDADLFPFQPHSWFGMRRAISHAGNGDELAAAAALMQPLLRDLHASNLRAVEVARVMTALVDALVVRALDLAAASSAPASGLVWLAVGSQARREMTPASTIRGALVCSEPPDEAWMRSLGPLLARCGIGELPIARSAEQWLSADRSDELTLTVVVERRPLWGTPVQPLPAIAGEEASRAALRALAERALAYQPPTGFDADAVIEADGARRAELDIRHAAVIPIVELGRWAGVAAGRVDGSTPERLAAGADAGALGDADARSLCDAFGVALELRVANHMEQLAAGSSPSDQVDPAALSPLARDHLRDVFRAVSAVQRKLRA
jgi:CBS domain-containing protein